MRMVLLFFFRPKTGHEGPKREQRFSSALSLTSALDGGGWLASYPPRKGTWFPLYRRLGGPQSRSGRVRKISAPPGFDPGTSNPWQVAIPTELSGPTDGYTENTKHLDRFVSRKDFLLIKLFSIEWKVFLILQRCHCAGCFHTAIKTHGKWGYNCTYS
jgi:hypothetical protein